MYHDLIRKYPLLSLLNARQLDLWLSGGREIAYAMGETIFQEGAAGTWADIVLAGRLRIVRRAPAGKEVVLGAAGVGELVGEYALLPPHLYTATCRAMSAVRLLRLPLPPLRTLIASWPDVQRNLKNWLRLHNLLRYLREQCFVGFQSGPSALALLDRTVPATFQPGTTIQADGLANDCWFAIESGQVRLAGADSAATPRELGRGDSFGEGALTGATGLPIATAVSATRCLCLPRGVFLPEDAALQLSITQSVIPHMSLWRERYRWIGQQEEADCGVAALAMVAQQLGRTVDFADLRRQIHVGPQGASLSALQQAAQALGLWALAARVEVSQLRRVQLPAIVHQTSGHYVALYECNEDGVIIGDPESGIVRLTESALARSWSGAVLLLR